MLDELVKSVRMHLSERLTSPLLGAFVVSWIIWNFRFLLIVISAESVESKLRLIDHIAFPGIWPAILHGIVGPLVTALAWIFLYPYPAKRVYEFARRRQRDLLEIRRVIEGETPLTVEDTRKFRREFSVREQELNLEIDRKDQEIAKLQRLLELAAQEKSVETPTLDTFRLDADFVEMLGDLVSAGGSAKRDDLISWSKFDQIKAENLFGELVSKEFLEEVWNEKSGRREVTMTQRGRAAWLESQKS